MLWRHLARAIVLCALLSLCMRDVVSQEGDAHVERGAPKDYNADVGKILGILINNLYTNRAIFLREVISNASDALDKIRLLYLTEPKTPVSKSGDEPTMDIRIRVDRSARTLTIRDGGVGMTSEELTNNLGMLGASGTKNFLEKMTDASKDAALIGQFGVGFYSVFLVADKVQVLSKSDQCEKQWVWESSGDGKFFLYEDPNGNTLGRGTELTLFLKEDADEFLSTTQIKDVVLRYSEFVHFPIFVEITETKRVPKVKEPQPEEDTKTDSEKSEDDVSVDTEDDSDEAKDKKDAEPEYEDVEEQRWERINEREPIWTRKVSEVSDDEHNKFFRAMSRDHKDPLYYSHFKAEGDVDFTSILYIPSTPGSEAFTGKSITKSIRLYVRRVFITDEFKDLLPRYLSFIHGVVDSDDLPLNVSREVLQENRVLKIIKKKLLRKVLTMFSELAAHDEKLEERKKKAEEKKKKAEEEGEEPVEEKPEGAEDTEEPTTPKGSKALSGMTYADFWKQFGNHIRLGVVDDHSNRSKLMKLLRYSTSKYEDKLNTLDEYVERMPKTQKGIYFINGESIAKIKALPVVEDALKRDIEVLYMTEPIDEYVVLHMLEYGGKKLINLAKENVKLGSVTARDRKIASKRNEKYDALLKWYKTLLGNTVSRVVLTQRITSEPVIVASSEYGVTAKMAQILKHQALTEKSADTQEKPALTLELNYLHPVIQELHKRIQVDEEDEHARSAGQLLYATACLQSGFELQNPVDYAKHVDTMVRSGLEVDADADIIEEDVSEYEIEEEGDEEESDGTEEDLDLDPSFAENIPLDFGNAKETVGEDGTKTMSFDLSGMNGDNGELDEDEALSGDVDEHVEL